MFTARHPPLYPNLGGRDMFEDAQDLRRVTSHDDTEFRAPESNESAI